MSLNLLQWAQVSCLWTWWAHISLYLLYTGFLSGICDHLLRVLVHWQEATNYTEPWRVYLAACCQRMQATVFWLLPLLVRHKKLVVSRFFLLGPFWFWGAMVGCIGLYLEVGAMWSCWHRHLWVRPSQDLIIGGCWWFDVIVWSRIVCRLGYPGHYFGCQFLWEEWEGKISCCWFSTFSV